MRNGNPNLPANPYKATAWGNSRTAQGVNPMGIGTESLQGGVRQPPKINSIPGYGTTPKPTRQPITSAEGASSIEQYLNSQGMSYGGSSGVGNARVPFAHGSNPDALQGYAYNVHSGYTLGGQPVPIEQYAQAYRLAYGEDAYQAAVASGALPAPSAAELLGF